MIKVTSRDALRAEVVPPGIYPGEVMSYSRQAAAKDASLLHKWELEVDVKGLRVPLKDYQVSEKAVSMGKSFFIACGVDPADWEKLVRGEEDAIEIDPNDCVGKKIRIQVINTMWNNRTQSEAGDFFRL